MACAIDKGRKDYSCKTIIGGVKNMFVRAWDKEMADEGISASNLIEYPSITDDKLFQYELVNDGNTFEETNEANVAAGTSVFTQTGTFVLKGQDAASQAALMTLAKAKVQIIIEDHMGNFRMAGKEYGASITVGTVTGGAIGDMNGYNVAFSATSTELAPFVDTTQAAWDTALTAGSGAGGSMIDPNA